MKILDLGELTGPVLLFGGPYSNLQALEALLTRAQALQIPAARMICTGDMVAYCADPVAVVQRIHALGIACVKGNCEEQLALRASDCGCGFEEGSTCSLLARGWYMYADQALGPQERAFLGACPDRVVFTQAGKRFAVIHGGASAINRFLWSVTPDAVLADEIAWLKQQVGALDAVICGHSGIAFQRRIGAVDWINAGVIGMPDHGGHPGTCFAVLTDGQAVFHRLQYDYPAARHAMEVQGLTQGYHTALETGYWPSEDVLPPELRRGASPEPGDGVPAQGPSAVLR